MSQFAVNTDYLRGYANELESTQRTLDSIKARLALIQLGSVLNLNASVTMIARLADCTAAVGHQADNLKKLSRGLEKIAQLYDRFERDLTEPQDGSNSNGGWLDWITDGFDDITSWFLEIFGDSSPIIGLLGTLFGFGNGNNAEALQDLFGALSDLIGAVFDTTGSAGATWWERVLGLNPAQLDDYIGNLGFGSNRCVASTASVVCQYLEYAMSFVIEGLENYNEFNGDMGARFWAETALEGVVDVGMRIGIGALACVLLPAGTPAAIGLAVVNLVVWGIDAISECLTGTDGEDGRDFSDVIADGILGEEVQLAEPSTGCIWYANVA